MHFGLSLWRFFLELCGVEWGSRKKVVKNFDISWGKFLEDEFPQIFTVDSKPLKPSNIWQNLVGLGLLAFVREARKWQEKLNFHRVGHFDRKF